MIGVFLRNGKRNEWIGQITKVTDIIEQNNTPETELQWSEQQAVDGVVRVLETTGR